jgi:hypothetical protein
MATDTRTNVTKVPMNRMRKIALAAGVLYLMTFVFSIPALGLYDNVLNNPDFVLGAGSDSGVLWGALFEIVMGLACIGTAVVLYPVAKRQSETGALGFVTSRVLEASMIFVGIVSLLAAFTLRQDNAGADATALVTAGQSLVAVHNWTFLLGPGLMPAVNALCLGSVLYRSRLVPRVIPTLGLVGAPILVASCVATLFGYVDQVSGIALLAALPVAVWEFSLGIWLTFKGFTPSPVIDAPTVENAALAYQGVAA